MPYICGMKHRIAHIVLMLLTVCNLTAQTTVLGLVTDGREPLTGANVFILGTIDGCLTDSLGRFLFTTSQTGEVTLKATFIGYKDYMLTADISHMHDLTIRMNEQAATINEVVVTASTFSFGKSDNFKTMDALDVVMAGNSCGDIVAALQTLPGTQMVGENGKLGRVRIVRTAINGVACTPRVVRNYNFSGDEDKTALDSDDFTTGIEPYNSKWLFADAERLEIPSNSIENVTYTIVLGSENIFAATNGISGETKDETVEISKDEFLYGKENRENE